MKAIVSPMALLKELKKMSIVIKSNHVIPMTAAVKFEFTKDKLTLTATDLETTYITSIDCVCSTPFSIPIEYSVVVEVCSKVFTPLEISVSDKTLFMVAGKYKSKFPLIGEAEHFPKIPVDDFDFTFDADGEFFNELSIANTVKHTDDPRMNMAALDFTKDCLFIVATNSSVLYRKRLDSIKAMKDFCIMVGNGFVSACKLFQETKISVGSNFIKAEYGNEIIISRLSENKFPAYKTILPKEIPYNTVINKDEFKSNLSQILVSAQNETKQCVLYFEKGKVKIESQDIDKDKQSETEMDLEHEVEIPYIAFNASMFIHFLTVMPYEEIDVFFDGYDKPNENGKIIPVRKSILFRPKNDDTILALIQPLMIVN